MTKTKLSLKNVLLFSSLVAVLAAAGISDCVGAAGAGEGQEASALTATRQRNRLQPLVMRPTRSLDEIAWSHLRLYLHGC